MATYRSIPGCSSSANQSRFSWVKASIRARNGSAFPGFSGLPIRRIVLRPGAPSAVPSGPGTVNAQRVPSGAFGLCWGGARVVTKGIQGWGWSRSAKAVVAVSTPWSAGIVQAMARQSNPPGRLFLARRLRPWEGHSLVWTIPANFVLYLWRPYNLEEKQLAKSFLWASPSSSGSARPPWTRATRRSGSASSCATAACPACTCWPWKTTRSSPT